MEENIAKLYGNWVIQWFISNLCWDWAGAVLGPGRALTGSLWVWIEAREGCDGDESAWAAQSL